MAKDPEIFAHQEWLGYVQPIGLVVSIPALLSARAYINRNFAPDHRRFLEALPADKDGEPIPEVRDFPSFVKSFFGWTSDDLYGSPGAPALPGSLEVALPEYNETLRPTYALRDFEPPDPAHEFVVLVQESPLGTDLDAVATDAHHWQASPQAKFERLLRQAGVPIGLLVNGRQIRLVYAPDKELSGHITFNIADMVTVAGRPICSAMLMLLCSERLYTGAPEERLPAILANSRKFQNVVSTQLAEQVLEALYELLRGFQAADDQAGGELLHNVLVQDADHVYHGLLTVLLRLVFLLFAEDRGLLSTDPLYANYYSVAGLYERLREDNGRYADLMDQRFGAWAQLLALFRLIYSGGSHAGMKVPPREGYLFDPDRYLFLEGRQDKNDKAVIPRVSDGVIFRVLSKLLLLGGERLSYRTLAVEQIGSVYQAIMGFSLQVATGRSIAIKQAKRHGAPATINLENLLSSAPDKRLKRFTDETDQKLTGQAAEDLKSAKTVEELLAALDRKIASAVTPMPVPKGAMVFQPSDERRKSGSHYTPSSLTGPIVEAALQPVLNQLGPNPTPAQILNLKVCDLAMGSAAFLVEACRQLGDALTKAWHAHNKVPSIPADEDEALHAQRLIAQRCLYGLDKNQMAADLAKLSLWLATLAKDHPFTFLDHSLRHGDALIGLTRKQIASFNWEPGRQQSFLEKEIRDRITRATQYRKKILEARENIPYTQLEQELGNADDALNLPRMVGDAAIAAFFLGDRPKKREQERKRLQALLESDIKQEGSISPDGEFEHAIHRLRHTEAIAPFHWELEFPEVFTVDAEGGITGGFDAIVGNPPFLGGTRISAEFGMNHFGWLTTNYPPAGHLCDLVAYFFRRAYQNLRLHGCFGLIATNTISQGDTREGGLAPILKLNGNIYSAVRRLRWPGEAAVIVSVVHVVKEREIKPVMLDGSPVDRISAFLLQGKIDESPYRLRRNPYFSSGSKIYGQGFLFDDHDSDANPLSRMDEVLKRAPKSRSRIFPYIGGEEVNTSPTQQPERFVIFLSDIKDEDELKSWPELAEIVRQKVKPERDTLGNNPNNVPLKRRWWAYQAHRPELYDRVNKLDRVLVNSQTSGHLAFAFLPPGWIYSQKLNVYDICSFATFCVVQSRVHEIWARFFGSSLKDDLCYTPSDCFETFPFSPNFESDPTLDDAGRAYYEFRANLMIQENEGLTKIYNRFNSHEESSPDILRLRELHANMDRAVLNSYGWADIKPTWEFGLQFSDVEDAEDENGRAQRKKYRYRWHEEVRDAVLARLLNLNREQAILEGQVIEVAKESTASKDYPEKRKRSGQSAAGLTEPLFASERGDD